MARPQRLAPPSDLRTWGPNSPCASDVDEPAADDDVASSLLEMGALVLSTADPLTKARRTHAAFSRKYTPERRQKFIGGQRSNHEKIHTATMKILMYQLCNSVAFVHDPKVLHRELKLHILLKDHKTMVLKIADLSLSHAIRFTEI
ncbi:Cyclin-dependent kinase B2-1 [Zea mays]|uniref:Cyclin-dependent kinase B2-1 n=1 Tax=Zea mays TaxID=4577 RepID=A0A3L6DKK7_MAIZE|nr:Cyclin-dependent kinase B2-1 [Zea mays]